MAVDVLKGFRIGFWALSGFPQDQVTVLKGEVSALAVALGARRASAVQNFLISQGVSANRMRTVSYGKERPIEVCAQEACFAKNRRAVTVLSMGAGA